MLSNPLKTLTKKEWLLWLASLAAVIISNFATNDLDLLTLISALLGVTSLIFAAKGSVWAQFLKIAERYGGGGHKGASGFVSEKMIFNKVK